ncbi:MAG: twin-arginine translocase TatA/TatE family subunit [Deltaproteobacteria bacterium]
MFGLSFWEIGIILAIALIVLGPTKLPELARSLGKGIREFRKATEDFKTTVDEEMHKPDPPKQVEAPQSEEVAELLPPEAADGEPVEQKKEAAVESSS